MIELTKKPNNNQDIYNTEGIDMEWVLLKRTNDIKGTNTTLQ